jgi:hypothetical protein
MEDDLTNPRWCPTWGVLRGQPYHTDCLVVVDESNKGECARAGQLEKKILPIVCPCECWTCKRAWSADGMPIIRNGKGLRPKVMRRL